MRINRVKYFNYVFCLCLITLYSINYFLIQNASVHQLTFIVLNPWYSHKQYGIVPLPFNQQYAKFVFEKKANLLAYELHNKLHLGVDFFFYSAQQEKFTFPEIKKMVDILLDSGADINFSYPDTGCTAVRNLLFNDDIVAANYLIDRGADLSKKSNRLVDKSEINIFGNICSWDINLIYQKYPMIKERGLSTSNSLLK